MPLLLPQGAASAATALADGALAGHGFANLYALTARGDDATVRAVNAIKGRPADQVGSITGPPELITGVLDLDRLPPPLDPRTAESIIAAFFALGPLGLQGPAATGLPALLTSTDDVGRTAQIIGPGHDCPSNDFLRQAWHATGPLFVTSANQSRHRTGAFDTPAHYRADGLLQDFGHVPGFVLLAHPDEVAARARYPLHAPMSTSVLALHRVVRTAADPRPKLVLERHGSLPAHHIRTVLDGFGFGLALGPGATRRLEQRSYPEPHNDSERNDAVSSSAG